MKLKTIALWLTLSAPLSTLAKDTEPQSPRLLAWDYIRNAATQDQKDRRLTGISYLVGGVAAIALPQLTTSPDSPMRQVSSVTLLPAGIYSIGYGGYLLLSNSPWLNFQEKVEALSGPDRDDPQWKLRREAHSRRVLLEQADSIRRWRYIWGSLEAGAGTYFAINSQSAPSIATAIAFYGLSAYHFLHRKAEERFADHLDGRALSVSLDGAIATGGEVRFGLRLEF